MAFEASYVSRYLLAISWSNAKLLFLHLLLPIACCLDLRSLTLGALGLRWCFCPPWIAPRDGPKCSRILMNLSAVMAYWSSRCTIGGIPTLFFKIGRISRVSTTFGFGKSKSFDTQPNFWWLRGVTLAMVAFSDFWSFFDFLCSASLLSEWRNAHFSPNFATFFRLVGEHSQADANNRMTVSCTFSSRRNTKTDSIFSTDWSFSALFFLLHLFRLCCLCFVIVVPVKENLIDHVCLFICLSCWRHVWNCMTLPWGTPLANHCLSWDFRTSLSFLSSVFRLTGAAFDVLSFRASKFRSYVTWSKYLFSP